MPATSKSQRRLMAMAYAYKKGELKDASEEVKTLAKEMSERDLKDFAETPETDLPEKITESLESFLSEGKKINEGSAYTKATNNELAQYIINLSNELVSAKSHNNKKEVKYLEKDIAEVKAVLQSRKTNESVTEQRDIWDEVANDEFGMDYDQLGSNEKQWVRDEIENNEDCTPANVNGMGSTSMPGVGDGTIGSGDIAHDLGATAEAKESVKESFLKFDQFINEGSGDKWVVYDKFNIKDLKKIQTALKQVKSNKQVKLTTTSTGSTSTSPKHLAKLMIKDIDELIIKMESLEKNLKLFHHTSSLARRK